MFTVKEYWEEWGSHNVGIVADFFIMCDVTLNVGEDGDPSIKRMWEGLKEVYGEIQKKESWDDQDKFAVSALVQMDETQTYPDGELCEEFHNHFPEKEGK